MTQQHPIAPPPELVQQWRNQAPEGRGSQTREMWIATSAAQWGADQELLACGNYLKQCAQWEEEDVTEFYNYRRPKPPSLKEQALIEFDSLLGDSEAAGAAVILRALEALPDD